MPFADAVLASGGSWIALSPGSPWLRAHTRDHDDEDAGARARADLAVSKSRICA